MKRKTKKEVMATGHKFFFDVQPHQQSDILSGTAVRYQGFFPYKIVKVKY